MKPETEEYLTQSAFIRYRRLIMPKMGKSGFYDPIDCPKDNSGQYWDQATRKSPLGSPETKSKSGLNELSESSGIWLSSSNSLNSLSLSEISEHENNDIEKDEKQSNSTSDKESSDTNSKTEVNPGKAQKVVFLCHL